MKLLKIKATGLKLFPDGFEIDFLATQRVSQDKNEMLTNLFSNIYTNNVISLVGKNASGKTQTLKVISFVIQLLQNKPINSIEHKDILEGLSSANTVIIESFFMSAQKSIHKLVTEIRLSKKVEQKDSRYIITNESLWTKPISSVRSKHELFNFDFEDKNKKNKKNIPIIRDPDSSFLLDDLSIIISLNKKYDNIIEMADSIEWTDFNGIRVASNFLPELIKLLDPSIEYLNCTKFEPELKEIEFDLKFVASNDIIQTTLFELNKYLSSGTIKGINVFTTAFYILKNSGYLLIDELENHFNIEIVSSFIGFFIDRATNPNGATLIFSTHYPELLDKLERNDCVYIVKKENGINVNSFTDFQNRNDIKKSEVLASGMIDNTMPTYEAFINLKRTITTTDTIKVGNDHEAE